MEGISTILSGSDNLFKYLFTLGILMIGIAVVYPLEKKHQIDLEVNHVNEHTTILNKDITALKQQIKDFQDRSDHVKNSIDSLRNLAKAKNKERIEDLRKDFNSSLDSLQRKFSRIESRQITRDYQEERARLLEQHSNDFKSYYFWMLVIGKLFAVSGFVGWCYLTFQGTKLKKFEISKAEKEQTQ